MFEILEVVGVLCAFFSKKNALLFFRLKTCPKLLEYALSIVFKQKVLNTEMSNKMRGNEQETWETTNSNILYH